MHFRIYTICDNVAGQSGPVFQAVNDGVAVRQYRGLLVQNPHLNPDEYTLWCIGEYTDEADPREDCGPCRLEAYPESRRVNTDIEPMEVTRHG